MIYTKFSKRQLLATTWWNRPAFRDREAIICDGAVRSGKTICMANGFILWAMSNFDQQMFGLCGRTVASLRRNVVINLQKWLGGTGIEIAEKRNENKLVVTYKDRTNSFYLFGGKDENSYTLVQGITLAGALLDEVALMPRTFVEQVCARCSVEGSKLWFNCNPGGPEHWFYKEWILKCKEKNALHIHFTMADNSSLAPSIRERYERLYSGVFYRRYILGEWCAAEGLVYELNENSITDERPDGAEYYISIDYGTLNPFSAGLWSVTGNQAVRIKEFYYDGRSSRRQLTDEEYCDEVIALAGDLDISRTIVDPSATSFITALKRRGVRVMQANNSVLDGIRRTNMYLRNGNIRVHRSCVDSIREFGLYSWDEKSSTDRVIKENDHAMDDIRYFCNTIMVRKVR